MTFSFTQRQQSAVDAPDVNLQIIAGAGSGKTQVMAARVAELLTRQDTPPASVVAFTFTERAAAELKERIYRMVQAKHGNAVGLAEMFVGTMHAYCLSLLQSHLFRFLKYSVLTDVQVRLLVDRNSRKSGLQTVQVHSGPSEGQHLRRGIDSRLYIQLLGVLREDDVDTAHLSSDVVEALATYRELLEHHRYLDYSEIILAAVEALESQRDEDEPLRRHLQGSLKHVMVDEYQDVNPLQERLIRGLHQLGAAVSVVGDDDQTIYQWRGSDISNIFSFSQRYKDVEQITLSDNFRSSPGIVDIGTQIARRNDPDRLPKTMLASSSQRFERGDILALSWTSPDDEAVWIADQIESLQGTPYTDGPGAEERGLSYSDCAILLRSVQKNAEPIVAQLRRRGIPFVVGGLSNLFEADEIWAAVSLFEYIVGSVTAEEVIDAWERAEVGFTQDDLRAGMRVLDAAKDWDSGERWSSYNLQRTFLGFLEETGFREQRIPPDTTGRDRSEVVLYNLGKFSQLISDFEQINFQSEPGRKYESFGWWLRRDAPDFYEEGGADGGYAQPDAVQILTVHRAKGLQWPAVFVPALQRNRFPSRRQGGRNIWHIIPRTAVASPERYDGSVEDETRLFYVAVTRSEKYLYCTFAPGTSNQYANPSDLFTAVTGMTPALTKQPKPSNLKRLVPTPRSESPEVVLSFSELKYFFECPYQFKLRFLYGFNPPLHEALGYGKSVHDALAEVHKRAMEGDLVGRDQAGLLVDGHLHVPFAYPELRSQLRSAAISAVDRYLVDNEPNLLRTEYAEQPIELVVAPGITVVGRVDLIRRLETDEVAIVDFKSTERAQDEDVTRQQLHVYAMGYQDLTGSGADLIEVLNLDERAKSTREVIDDDLLAETRETIVTAGGQLRDNDLPAHAKWCESCDRCDLAGICRRKPKT